MSQILLKLEKLEEVEKTAKSTIQAIQQEIDESAKQMATQNAEYQKQKQALEVGIGFW
jgi:FtsZ-binding cell division protein ZapB